MLFFVLIFMAVIPMTNPFEVESFEVEYIVSLIIVVPILSYVRTVISSLSLERLGVLGPKLFVD